MDEQLKQKLESGQRRIEDGIERLLPPAATRPPRLHEAMRYSLRAGGKRIRPFLLLQAAELHPPRADPLPAAVAVECLHTYTLIHDDLPAIDNSDLRRGRPSCHKQFDEPTAILAGDALLTHAFFLIADNYAPQPALAAALVSDLAEAAGSEKLIGGQMEDIRNEGVAGDANTLRYIHENKTAALLTAALLMGLRFSDPREEALARARTVGRHLGMAFQIVDDLLDATSDAGALGKPAGHDSTSDKSTYVALHGIEGARTAAREHTAAAIEAAEALGGNNHFLLKLIRELEHRIH